MDAKTEILYKALMTISSYGEDGICPYGCDTPYIASKALSEYASQPDDNEDALSLQKQAENLKQSMIKEGYSESLAERAADIVLNS